MRYSIITINYNNYNGLRKTIESVINQSCKDFEYIVIDGGSTDGSREILEQYADRIDYWVSEPDNGVYYAMNKGIRAAKGEYLNFMNSGDIFYNKDVLARVTSEGSNADILVGKDYHYNEDIHKGFSSILPPRISMVTFFMETLPHQGTFIKRSLFADTLYDESLRIAADWAFYVKKIVIEDCSVNLLPIIVSHREPGGISCTQAQNQKEERDTIIHQIMPTGVYRDYQTLAHLDKSTLYKLMNICEHEKARKMLTLCIKVIKRLYL